MKRPLFVIGFAFGGCLLAARLMGFHASLIAAVLCALLFVLTLSMRALRNKTILLAALLSAAAAFSMFSVREHLAVRPLQRLDGERVTADLWLTEEVAVTDASTLYLAQVQAGELPAGVRLLLFVTEDDNAPELYNRATATLRLTATDAYRTDGVSLMAWAEEDWTVTLTGKRPWKAGLTAWRSRMMAHIDERTGGETAALIRAVCFGDKSRLSKGIRNAFSDAGLSHLTAVSGFHMSVIALGFFGLLCLLRVKRRLAAALSLPIPLLFAALTGFSYSALRAGVMCLLVMLATVTRRQTDAKNSLGGAVALLLLVDPNAIYDLGFLLSVTATLGVVCAAQWGAHTTDDHLPPVRRAAASLWTAVRVTLAATAATMPVIALTFGRLPILAPLSNLLGEPAASVVVVSGCVGTLLQSVPWLSFLAGPLFLAAGTAARFLLWWARWIASLPPAVFWLDRPYRLFWACAVPFALWLGWRLLRGHGLRVTAMLLVVALCAASLVNTLGMRGVTTLTVVPSAGGVGLLLTRDGHHALVLTDENDTVISAFLTRRGIDRLDFVLYTKEQTLIRDDNVCRLDGETIVTFWGEGEARLHDNWLLLTVGDTRILLCPANGDATALPAEERQATLLIFDRVPPLHAAALSAGGAVLCGTAEELSAALRVLPWGAYPLRVATDNAVTLHTRGQSDLTGMRRDSYALE